MTRFVEIWPHWQKFITLLLYFEGSLSIWQDFERILASFFAIGQILSVVNGQIGSEQTI